MSRVRFAAQTTFAHLPASPLLSYLNLASCLTIDSASALTSLSTLTRLQAMVLADNIISKQELCVLSQLTVLRSLSLADTRTMATLRGLSQLRDLDLAGNVLCTGIELELRCLPALRHLCVGLEQLTPGVAESLSGYGACSDWTCDAESLCCNWILLGLRSSSTVHLCWT